MNNGRRTSTKVYVPASVQGNHGIDVHVYDPENPPRLGRDVEQYLRPRTGIIDKILWIGVIFCVGAGFLFFVGMLLMGNGAGNGASQEVGTQNCGGLFTSCTNVVVNPNSNMDASKVQNTVTCSNGAVVAIGTSCGINDANPSGQYAGQFVPTVDPTNYSQYIPAAGIPSGLIIVLIAGVFLIVVSVGFAKRKRA